MPIPKKYKYPGKDGLIANLLLYIEDVLLKYTVQHSAHLVRKCGSVALFTKIRKYNLNFFT